jgi:uncharacterized protein (TIGR00730 family)
MKVAVFCSCNSAISPFFLAEIEELGAALAEDGHAVVYGGADGGCMGALARGVQAKGGHLIGVIPRMDFMDGLVQKGLSEEHIVPNLSDRKSKMNELAEAFIVFPGGIGTLDEAFEVLALKSAGNFRKPVIFYNFMDAWSPLLEAMELLVQQKLIRHRLGDLLLVLDKPAQVRENLKNV